MIENIICNRCGSVNVSVYNDKLNILCNDCNYLSEINIVNKKLLLIDEYDNKKYINANGDIIIAKGGDGTLLKAINEFRYLNKPFFGIASGTKNFLMNKEEFIIDNHNIESFYLIKAKLYFKDNKIIEFQSFNEIMIGGDMNSWIDFNINDEDNIIGNFKGGGVIFSTAQGSTGINKNNNGVILTLSTKNWAVTGDKTNKHISHVIEPNFTEIFFSSRTPVYVWGDGQHNKYVNPVKVEISQGDKIDIVFNNFEEFKRKRGEIR